MGKLQMDMTLPRCSCLKVSAIVPEPTVMGQDPATPAKKRNTISIEMLVDLEQPMLKARNRNVLTWYTGKRPYSSEAGAMIKGPKTYPRTYIDTTRDATARLSSLNSSITRGTPGAKVDDAKGLIRESAPNDHLHESRKRTSRK